MLYYYFYDKIKIKQSMTKYYMANAKAGTDLRIKTGMEMA